MPRSDAAAIKLRRDDTLRKRKSKGFNAWIGSDPKIDKTFIQIPENIVETYIGVLKRILAMFSTPTNLFSPWMSRAV